MIKLDWNPVRPGIGSAFGYSTHQKNLRLALERNGVKIDPSAKIAVHIFPPYHLTIKRFKTNILTTAFEYDRLPSQWDHHLAKSDLIIVPCEQNRQIFQARTDTPVEACPEGVGAERFPYIQREHKEPFVFLYLGDDNPRKGTRHISRAWEMWNEKYPQEAKKSLLLMKMTSYSKEKKLFQMTENAFADYRVLPNDEDEDTELPTLGALYEYANAFLFPSMGEGWGLPLSEAMCSGLPCIYTPLGGPEDFALPDYAYPIKYELKEIVIQGPYIEDLDPINAADPSIESIVDQMHEIYTHYDEALEKGKTAAAAMRAWFSWDQAAQKYIQILKRYVL
jgi:glycosyltransferase involved in cell wall biosynthesis